MYHGMEHSWEPEIFQFLSLENFEPPYLVWGHFHRHISGDGIKQEISTVSKMLKTRQSWDRDGCFEYHKPYQLKNVGDDFFMDFSFFTYRFFWFISQMGNPLGVYGTNYKVKKNQKLIIGENMAPFRLAFSKVILL